MDFPNHKPWFIKDFPTKIPRNLPSCPVGYEMTIYSDMFPWNYHEIPLNHHFKGFPASHEDPPGAPEWSSMGSTTSPTVSGTSPSSLCELIAPGFLRLLGSLVLNSVAWYTIRYHTKYHKYVHIYIYIHDYTCIYWYEIYNHSIPCGNTIYLYSHSIFS